MRTHLLFLLLLAVSAHVCAQAQNGQISGSITDPAGAVVPGVEITATNRNTGLVMRARSNQAGVFVLAQVPPGRYVLELSVSGFAAPAITVEVSAGSTRTVEIRLALPTAQTELSVSASAAAVDLESARLSEDIDAARIEGLPLNGRNVFDLLQLAPGAVSTRAVLYESGAGTAVNGVRVNFNGFYVNGSPAKRLSGGYTHVPIQDSVLEMHVLTLNNSAEFGSSAGAITNVITRAGTNAFHGSASWFIRNHALDATPFFLNQIGVAKPPLRYQQYGTSISGPIRRNRLFFFTAFQAQNFVTTTTAAPVLAESAEFRQAVAAGFPDSVAALLYQDFAPRTAARPAFTLDQYIRGPDGAFGGASYSGGGFSRFSDYLCAARVGPDLVQRFATLFGVTEQDQGEIAATGCGFVPAIQAGVLDRHAPFLAHTATAFPSRTSDTLNHGQQAMLRLDWSVSSTARLAGSVSGSRLRDEFTGAVPGFSPDVLTTGVRGFRTPSRTLAPTANLSYTTTHGTAAVNDLRMAYFGVYSRIRSSHPGVPGILMLDGSLGFGSLSGYPRDFREHVYSITEAAVLNRGRHTWKFGGELRRNQENSDFNIGRPTYLFFDPLFFAADAPFLQSAGVVPSFNPGEPSQLSSNVRRFSNWELGLYVADTWRISPRLTLTLGLRYDLFTRHQEASGLETTFLLGPGNAVVEDLRSGRGQLQSASFPAGTPGCDSPEQVRAAQLAGVCGPGGFAPADQLGAPDRNNFGPRVGLVWDVLGNSRLALRGGFGVSYENSLYDMLGFSRYNLPYYSANQVTNFLVRDIGQIAYGPQSPGEAVTYVGTASAGQFSGSGPQATGNINAWNPANANLAAATGIVLPAGLRDPYVMNWFVGTQWQAVPNGVLEVNYVGTAGRDLFRSEDINRLPGGRLPPGTCVVDDVGRTLCSQTAFTLGSTGRPINPVGRVNPNFGTLRVWTNAADSSYHALQAAFRGRIGAKLQLAANYTWSHAIDTGSTWFTGFTSANGAAAGDGFPTDPTRPDADRGSSLFDIRHRVTVTYVWELPPVRAGAWAPLLSGWQLNGAMMAQTGAHWSPFDPRPRLLAPLSPEACAPATFDPANCANVGGDYNLDGQANDRPNAAGAVSATAQQWANGFGLPGGFFSAPCLGCIGNLGRNSFVGPNYWAWDASLFRKLQLNERWALQLRVEAFNVLNRTNFQLPGNAGHNRINDPLFGKAGGTFNPRQIQLGVRVTF